ncbi:Ppx/GppA family phosphatase [Curvibacter sp. CHRR-16]|uniref:Ppx/GppA phosphatase family protein n=1 Tax=Curvibacter sp. CHRR-16 TaxID=2835872 RepID=UPI001BD98E90|nr:Ppx/GppA phosphatase family protein [Curvibacter sp. CHRR-16]MBT0568718.1 Ppx/GppA family phosphatase [Curvibacter sp. CHRR-16]
MQNPKRLAAVDLGSNSFRLEIGRVDHGSFLRTEYLKETVRQGAGLDEERNLTTDAMQAGWDCLARFGERLADFAPEEVRAVATQTLREARNRDVFLERANAILGFPIDVISGQEEARLIYQGVAHLLPETDEKRLVIDIGGRSTELILGHGHQTLAMESYRVGSIAWSKRFFADGVLNKKAFEIAEIAAKAVLDEAFGTYQASQWQTAYGSAGTVGAVGDVLQANGFAAGTITQEGLDWLLERLLSAQHADKVKLPGLREDRKAIIGGGLSVIRALFSLLGIRSLRKADGGLRHGLICDLLDAEHPFGDLRQHSVDRLARKFEVDSTHGERVGRVATQLLRELLPTYPAISTEKHPALVQKLQWAAQLHELGGFISHDDHHKHGAYILDHVDAAGFSLSEMHRLSLLVLGHRGKLRKLEAALGQVDLVLQLVCLRLAVILCHARQEPAMQALHLSAQPKSQTIHLQCPADWARNYPQSAHLLREEILAWQKTGWMLTVNL